MAPLLPRALRSIRPSCGTATCARAWWSPSSGGKKMRWRAHCDRSTERNRAGTRSSFARMVATPAMPSSTPNSTSFWSPAESHNATCGISTLRLGVRPMQAKFDSRSRQRLFVPCGMGLVRDVPKRGPIPLSRLRAIACAAWRGALPCRPFNRFQFQTRHHTPRWRSFTDESRNVHGHKYTTLYTTTPKFCVFKRGE